MQEALRDAVEVQEATSMREAVERAFELASPDGTVLLAPACASFDQYQSFEHRGRHFEELVRELR